MARVGGNAGTTRGWLRGVNKWTKEAPERMEAAYQNGLLDMFDELRAATPVDTGNLRDSLVVHKAGQGAAMVTGPGDAPAVSGNNSGISQSIATIMSMKLGDRAVFAYHATYAMRLNYGFSGMDSLGRYYNQAGRFWIERVGSRYRSIMRRAATRLRIASK